MPKKIMTMSDEQWADLAVFREEWYRIGSATGPTYRPVAQQVIAQMYKTVNAAPEPRYIWVQSPATAWLGITLLSLSDSLRGSLRGSLSDSLRDGLRGSLLDSLLDSLRCSLGGSLWGSLWGSLRDSLSDSLRGSLGGSLGDSLLDSLRGSLRGSLSDSLRDSLRGSLRGSLSDSLRDSLWDGLRDSLGGSLGDSLWDGLGDSLGDSLRDSLGDSLWGHFVGQYESYWIAFYQWMPRLGIQYAEVSAQRLEWWATLARTSGWWWPFRQVSIIADRPNTLHVDGQYRLHCEDGPAMAFADGYGIWAWHGVRISQNIIEHPEEITIEAIHGEENAERRRIMIERWGWERYIETTGAVLRDADTEPAGAAGLRGLWQCDGGEGPLQILVCCCASTGRTYHLEVPPEVENCRQAANWLAQQDEPLELLART